MEGHSLIGITALRELIGGRWTCPPQESLQIPQSVAPNA
jgi:hypothetical protein